MTVRDVLTQAQALGALQRSINAFVDEFRGATRDQRWAMIRKGPDASGPAEGLIAAVVSALCREVSMRPPAWVGRTNSPQPFFAFPARGFALRVRLMLESPPPFRCRNVFVPENYLRRA